ncbi:MAG: hypothetical protein ABIP75_07505 [Pyrinomonadaceae bacterium]
MSNDEVQKRMEFIIEQQAQFTVNIQKLEESQKRLEESQRKTDEQIGRLEGAFVGLFNLVVELQQAQKRTEESLAKLTLAQASTDDRLNSLILVVEKYFSGKQNGSHPENG